MRRVSVAEAVGRALSRQGVAHVFGVTGSGNFRVTEALIAGGVPFTAARHEMGAATMADAYGRTSGRVAVVSLHQGCGLSNALTGIAEAAKCHTPLLVLTGDTARGDVTSNFHIDQDAAVDAMGATSRRLRDADTAVEVAITALRDAISLRTPVVLSMPVDLQDEMIDIDPDAVPLSRETAALPAASETTAAPVFHALSAAERPVILAGRGARGARNELERLADAAGALLVTSAGARGLFVGNEWALDVMGGFATDGATRLISQADTIIAFGAGLNKWTTRSGTLLVDTTVVHVDDRAKAIGLHRHVDTGVVGDVAAVATTAASLLEASVAETSAGPRRGYRTAETAAAVAASRYWRDQPFDARPSSGLVDPQNLTNRLDDILPWQRTVVPDGGNVNCYPGAHLRVPDASGFCMSLGFQAIGMGLAAGVGAALARPDRLSVVGTGDGSFMMSLVELDTAVRERLAMVIVVYNDSAYGAELHLFDGVAQNLDIARFPDTDIAAIARGFGCDALTVRHIDDVDAAAAWLAEPQSRPLVIDAKIAGAPSWLMARGQEERARAATEGRVSH